MSSRVDIILISRVDTITVIGLLVHNDYSVTCENWETDYRNPINACYIQYVTYWKSLWV